MTNIIKPGEETIGIIGGGQLGQMMALSAKEMGFCVGILDPVSNAPAAQVADWSITADYDDEKAIKELVEKSSVVTYEFENVNANVLKKYVSEEKLPQGIQMLIISKNREYEKAFLNKLNLPIASYEIIQTVEELKKAVQKIGYPSVLKTCLGGYDGKGQIVIHDESDINEAERLLEKSTCVLESWIEFEKEISVIVAGDRNHTYEVFPVAENHHKNNVLFKSIVPAEVSSSTLENARQIALKVAETLKTQGVMTIEMFVTREKEVIVNEIAPRPHNSGHYSIEGCNVSQFDLHIRGICGWPLPKISLYQPTIMLNLLGEEVTRSQAYISEKPDWYFHYYGKEEIKAGRKMGHITIMTDNINKSLEEIKKTKIWK
ncbi:5-(carboxyamino)imidazole ribonucleotide synthase [Vagococcus vulneris]|uniref:N5-carboxyaminoimidazole ribonucleotide synthase n=1 Tax=Vagococcus vulneris TaxID=1977869 RepID=A0A429ZX62_9ENTE|nr:5-(carboxyamino)imidazole ribonucleotide synthase [Vagococcus vulneris]RST98419.1 5-(carboxyamino)imidazole ribonucleotide synthase [Vagococcus vulneris]